jgi:photosynthetic reaction center M subunit
MGVISLAGAVWFVMVGLVLGSGGLQPGGLPARPLLAVSLDPPAPEYGLRFPPMAEGGYFLIASFFLLVSGLAWWVRTYLRAAGPGDGQACVLGLRQSAIWLFLVLASSVRS